MASVSYQVSFPGPVGKIDQGGLASTVVVVFDSPSKEALESNLGEQIAKYLRGADAIEAKSISCVPALLGDRSSGQGAIFAGPSPLKARKVGNFQVERMAVNDARAT